MFDYIGFVLYFYNDNIPPQVGTYNHICLAFSKYTWSS